MRYIFSGHESFHCKSLWLKKGYDYLCRGKSFNDADAVAELGVGKNMVAGIRFWLKAFGLTELDKIQPIATYLFDDANGKDPYCEDIATLWLLHFQLVSTGIASIYTLGFTEFQRERKEFDREQFHSFIKRKCSVPEQKNVYNENTVKKDIGVFMQNYVAPRDLKQIENFTSLLIGLNLIFDVGDGKYRFAETETFRVPDAILLYALFVIKGADKVVSFDKIQYVGLLFCMPINNLLERLMDMQDKYADEIRYTDNSGIRNVVFAEDFDAFRLLDSYYNQQ